jgi:excisionase family DNA binding protein
MALLCSSPRAMSEPWVSVDEVSRHLGVAKDTICRWIETCARVGRLWKFKLSETDAWVQRGGPGGDDRGSNPTPKGGRR